MRKGKRIKKSENKAQIKKFVLNVFFTTTILTIIGYVIVIESQDNSIQELEQPFLEIDKNTMLDSSLKIEENTITQSVLEKEKKQYPKVSIEKEYKNYSVDAKLEIPVISLETYVLTEYSAKALNISVNKFWGVNPNEIGNYCIVGHNAPNKNMFRNLQKLEVGDRLFISDNEIGKIEYEIYDIYKVPPDDVSCLNQETQGGRETTLITCTNDSQKRIIIKAREVLN